MSTRSVNRMNPRNSPPLDQPGVDSYPLQPRHPRPTTTASVGTSDDENNHDLPTSAHAIAVEDTQNGQPASSTGFLSGIASLMSRLKAPLFLRSSPAQGTGSYGALPVHLAPAGRFFDPSDTEADDTESEATRRAIARESVRKARKASKGKDQGVMIGGEGSESSTSRPEVLADRIRKTRSTDVLRPKEETVDVESDGEGSDTSSSGWEGDDPPDNSPYPQVRASVAATDNTTLSINTPRMWTLSLLFSLLGSATNLFFSLRYPSVSITPVIALLLVHPLGLMWDRFLKRVDDPVGIFEEGVLVGHEPIGTTQGPQTGTLPGESTAAESLHDSSIPPHRVFAARPFEKSTWRRALRLWLAQGKWNEKEHACVYISSNVSFGFAFATDVIVEQHKFYNQTLSITYQILLILSTQILGYTFAGLTRRYLVRPGGMIWPGTLMSTAMFTTLHKEENKIANGWRISRWHFFAIVWFGAFAWYFVPGLLMPALSYFNVMTWFAPNNVILANLFGVASGLGLFPLTFDWTQIAYIGSPLLTPFWAALNVVGGLVVVMWIFAPIMYYANVLYTSYLPILSAAVFDNTGHPYDVTKILTPDFTFDEEAYKSYSRVYLPITYVLSYALQFAALTALITHTACWHGADIWRQWRRSFKETQEETKASYKPLHDPSASNLNDQSAPPASPRRGRRPRAMRSEPNLADLMSAEDVHCRLMRRYKDAPITWYLLTFVTMTAIGIFVVEYYPIHLPWYGLLLALGICAVFFILIGIVTAITNQQSSLYLFCQLICGIVFPGRPVANMVFVSYGYITSQQGIKFSSDLKLGHYMKIPPRILFTVQMVATIVSSLTQIGVLNWMFTHVPDICTPAAINGFTCPIARVHFNGSILWGLVGPARFFGPTAIYRPLVWAFLVGAIAPLVVWVLGRKQPRSVWRKVNLPVLFGSLGWIPPATGLNFSVWALVCYVFNYVIRRRASAWWGKYTMTLSAALDSGVAFALVVVFFGLIYPGFMNGFKWWGTEVYKQGCDWQACAYKALEPGETFGPKTW